MTPALEHGKPSTYTDHACRCTPCRRAVATAQRQYQQRRKANGGQPLTVPKTGAVRRLRALMALGWPRRDLARLLGYHSDALSALFWGNRELVTLTTHQRIADLYDRLSMTPGPSQRTRDYAREHHWPTPLAWDDIDIDDPTAEPIFGTSADADLVDDVVVQRILAGDPTPARGATNAERRAVVAAWAATGRPLAVLGRLTGWKPERYQPPPHDREDVA